MRASTGSGCRPPAIAHAGNAWYAAGKVSRTAVLRSAGPPAPTSSVQAPVADGSAAQEAAAILTGSTVVAAFHHVSAVLLDDAAVSSVDTDVLVLGDDRDATDLVASLADVVPGMRGVYGGRLRNAHQVEALTANLISVNRRYKAHAGLRVTDI